MRVVARNIEKVSTQLVEVAETVAEAMEEEEGGQPEQEVQEDTEILRRDWSSQARLIQTLIPKHPFLSCRCIC